VRGRAKNLTRILEGLLMDQVDEQNQGGTV